MNLNKLPDVTDFNMVDCTFGGDDCVWIFPHMEGVKWATDNLKFRSSIWRKSDGLLISAGFKKFFNWEEQPDIHPAPNIISNKTNIVEKVDGSCLIVSKYKGELITRTRRALTSRLTNGHELEAIKARYPKAFDNPILDNHSLLYEWVTPSNRIVLKYDEDIKLIGCINHDDYSYFSQHALDSLSKVLEVPRPKYFNYSNIAEMIEVITNLKGEEGVCVYYGNDQHIRKLKSDWYRSIHNFRGQMNLKHIVDLYLQLGMPLYEKFCATVMEQFQYEGLQEARPLISQICDAKKEVDKILEGMARFVDNMSHMKTRKEKALHAMSSYGPTTNRVDIVFTILDGKDISLKQFKKLLFQVLVT